MSQATRLNVLALVTYICFVSYVFVLQILRFRPFTLFNNGKYVYILLLEELLSIIIIKLITYIPFRLRLETVSRSTLYA